MAADLDCTACGACCVKLLVALAPGDEARLSADEVLALTTFDEATDRRRLKQLADGSCVALRREGGRHLCAIYERRPDACRDFERGSRRCLQLREVRGLEPRR